MNSTQKTGLHLLRLSWTGLLAWQLTWHALLPAPGGSENWILALIAIVPLLPLTKGVMKKSYRSLVLGMFLLTVYFIIGVMETWSSPDQRVAALIQVVLCCCFFAGLVLFNRPTQAQQDRLTQERPVRE